MFGARGWVVRPGSGSWSNLEGVELREAITLISRQVMRVATTLTFVFTSLMVSRGLAFQDPAPGVIHALLVADSDSNLGDSVKQDVSRLSGTLTYAFQEHPSRLRLYSPLMGNSVTVSAIESFFKDLSSGPDDTLLFYFSGHGQIRAELGHVLNFTNPDEKGRKILPRFELLTSMTAKKPRLIVVLTDCCSAIRKPPPTAGAVPPVKPHCPPPPAFLGSGRLLASAAPRRGGHHSVLSRTSSLAEQFGCRRDFHWYLRRPSRSPSARSSR